MGRKKEVVYTNGRLSGKYLTQEDCDRLESLRKLDKEKGFIKDLKNVICELSPSEIELVKASGSADMIGEVPYGELENLQTVAVAYMYFAKRLILGDSVGIGKTVETCGLINLLESEYQKKGMEFRFLYLTIKTAVSQAQDEMIRFTGNYVDKVYGDKSSVAKFINQNRDGLEHSVVGPHSLLNSIDFQEYMRGFIATEGYNPFDLLIIDESGDILCNPSTQTYKNAQFFEKQFDRIILLNATSFEKELRNFYSQLAFIDDTFLPTKTEFSREYEIMSYTGPYPRPSGKYRNADQFKHLVGYRYFARTRKSSGAYMKDCTADVVVTPLSKEQRALLKATSMPGMVYDCPSYFNMGVETNTETTPKLKALVSLFNNELKNVSSVLIYSRYKESQKAIQDTLKEQGISSCIMNGETSQQERDNLITKFKLGDIRVLITNVQKGLNFGHCNHCIFYTYDPNPNKMVQFEGRMTRSFNIENKHVYLLVSKGNELKTLKSIVADRAEASDLFAGSDFSCVLSLLLDGDRLNSIK